MEVILKFLYDFINKKDKYKRGWKQYIIYPFVWLLYKLNVKYVVYKFIESPNDTMNFKNTIIEYASFLTVLNRMMYPDKEISDIIQYKETSNIFVTYTDSGKVKSVLYVFSEKEVYNIGIKVNVTDNDRVIIMEVKTENGNNVFNFNSLIDSRLINVRDNAERIIRTDIAANIHHILLKNNY